MISNNDFARIAALDLNPIKVKLMHKESGEGWSLEHANAMETEYRRFLYLMKAFPTEQTAPLVDVDTFWHYHILDTKKYARDCEQALGYFLHHYPYVGMAGEDGPIVRQQAGTRMRELYESTFGESYVRAAGVMRACAPQPAANTASYGWGPVAATQTAWCGLEPVPGVRAADVQTAWCGLEPVPGVAAKVQTAWCGVEPVPGMAAKVQTAWCGVEPVPGMAAKVQTAWCGVEPVPGMAAKVQTAWCGLEPVPGLRAADVQTAWCGMEPVPGVHAADVQSARAELAHAA